MKNFANPSLTSYSNTDDHFLQFDFEKNETSLNKKLEQMLAQLQDFCSQSDLRLQDIVYCKIYTTDLVALAEVKNKLKLLLDESKLLHIPQQPLLAEHSLFFYLLSSDYLEKHKTHFLIKSFRSKAFNIKKECAEIFQHLENFLQENNLSLTRNVIRSWIYVNDIDKNYHAIVAERAAFFEKTGILLKNQFLASTGIGATLPDGINCQMDFLLFENSTNEPLLVTRMINHEIMPDTIKYGVHFERGLKLTLKGKKHYYISGTASIDPKGEVLHLGDVEKQTIKTLENIDLLLKKSGSVIDDLAYAVIYLREREDINKVEKIVRGALKDIPLLFVLGPVCRPSWLVEIEGVAINQKI